MQSNDVVPGSAEDRDITRFQDKPFPNYEDALARVQHDFDALGMTPYHFEIGILASGEVTYKVRVKEQEETLSGLISL
jgi:hypothetical protein